MAESGAQAVTVNFARRDMRPLGAEERHAYEQACFAMYVDGLRDAVHTSVNSTHDIIDMSGQFNARAMAEFRAGRGRWLGEYERSLHTGYRRRIGGHFRTGRRTDTQGGLATLQLLDPLDQGMQVALIGAVRNLQCTVSMELIALGPRLAVLLGEKFKDDFDNPFDPQYVLDAIGATARSVYSTPSLWRALMQRVVIDITPVLHKIYITQNRYLADRNVLPDIKAWVRNRSRHRPTDDREVVAAFSKLHAVKAPAGSGFPQIRIPAGHFPGRSVVSTPAMANPVRLLPLAEAAPQVHSVSRVPAANLTGRAFEAALAALVKEALQAGSAVLEREAGADCDGLPSVDDLLAKGVSRDLVAIIDSLQRMDLPTRFIPAAVLNGAHPIDRAFAPLNLIPLLRAAMDPQLLRPENAVTMDFVALLFDYIFADPSIPSTLHGIFVRLQLSVLKAALLDQGFFVDYTHPARRLLDDLGEAAIGASSDEQYFDSLRSAASTVVDEICASFRHDEAVIDRAAAKLRHFMAEEQKRAAVALSRDITTAAISEQRDLARSEALAMIRDRLAGVDVPPRIRAFIEIVWVDYVAEIKRNARPEDPRLAKPLRTLENLVWSISATERHTQRKRLCELIPSLISELRRGCVAVNLPAERTRAFMNDLFEMHRSVLEQGRDGSAADASPVDSAPSDQKLAADARSAERAAGRVFDFVCEMIIGTWIDFVTESKVVTMRLCWVSPLRSRYVFGARGQSRGWILTPEELAHDIESGNAAIKVEPVPLVDRAVNAAFETLGSAGA